MSLQNEIQFSKNSKFIALKNFDLQLPPVCAVYQQEPVREEDTPPKKMVGWLPDCAFKLCNQFWRYF